MGRYKAATSGRAPARANNIESARRRWYDYVMNTIRYVYWQDEDMWLGYVEEFPDYMTQGASLEELQENLRDIYETPHR